MFLIEKGPGPPSTSGYADGHRVQIYVSITNTEGVIAILMLSCSRGGHIVFSFLEIIRGPGPLAPLAIASKCMSLSQIQKALWPF